MIQQKRSEIITEDILAGCALFRQQSGRPATLQQCTWFTGKGVRTLLQLSVQACESGQFKPASQRQELTRETCCADVYGRTYTVLNQKRVRHGQRWYSTVFAQEGRPFPSFKQLHGTRTWSYSRAFRRNGTQNEVATYFF